MTQRRIQSILDGREHGILLDCRPDTSFARAHLPGALHLPFDELPDRYGEIERAVPSLIVVPPRDDDSGPEGFLREHGFDRVETMVGGLSRWAGAVERGQATGSARPMLPEPGEDPFGVGPMSSVVRDALPYLRRWGRVLDLACGRGRNALALAAEGFEVVAVDRSEEALEAGSNVAASRHRIEWTRAELEGGDEPWRPDPNSFDGVVVSRYLWRPLLPAIARAVRPGGVIAYETFLIGQQAHGHPRNPHFLFERGELARAFVGFAVLSHREGPIAPPVLAEPQVRASVIARRPMERPV